MSEGASGKRGITVAIGVLILIAVVLRIALALIHPFMFPDSGDYDHLARAIVEGKAYQTEAGDYASRMPGYPAMVAGIYFLCGYSIRAVLVLQAFFGGGVVYLTWLLVRRINIRVALVAAAIAAIDPLSIAFSASLLTEVPFTFLLLLAVYVCVRMMDRPRLWMWVALGVIWVMAIQLRPAVLWCIVPLMGCLVYYARGHRDRIVHVVGMIGVVLLVQATLIPWQQRCEAVILRNEPTVQNDIATRVHFTTLEGISLYEAVYPEATGGPRQDVIALPEEMKPLNEAQRNEEWMRRAWQCIRNEPGRIGMLAFRKVGRTWSPVLNAGEFQNLYVQAALAIWNIPLFLLAVIGLFRSVVPLRMRIMLFMPILYFTLLHAIFMGSVRYRVPLIPLVGILAAAGMMAIARNRANDAGLQRSTMPTMH